ncbi:MAG: hypothetical protein ACI39H_09725 [Lachnospiraceae bacterium]
MDQIYSENPAQKNPSRQECERVIKRILVTEVLTKGRNDKFKSAADFMSYFESLYPASEALTKQVQRAIKAMELPKDEHGYLIINKTKEQLEEEKDLSYFLKKTGADLGDLSQCEPLLLRCSPSDSDYLLTLITRCLTLKDKYETVFSTSNGVLFYTKQKNQLEILLNSLIK